MSSYDSFSKEYSFIMAPSALGHDAASGTFSTGCHLPVSSIVSGFPFCPENEKTDESITCYVNSFLADSPPVEAINLLSRPVDPPPVPALTPPFLIHGNTGSTGTNNELSAGGKAPRT